MDDIRIGIAGLGKRGLWWIRLLQRIGGYRIVSIYDPIQALHERALEAIPYRQEVRCHEQWEPFLADPGIEAVGLCVRCRQQGGMAADALEAGKHVHAEVPAAHTLEDCWRIVLAAERSGGVYQLAEQVRAAGWVQACRRLREEGRFGQISYCEGQYFGHYIEQYFQDPGTGAFCGPDQAARDPAFQPNWLHRMTPIHYIVHDLSPLLRVLDDRPVQVVGMGTDRPSRGYPTIDQSDVQVALIKTAGGAVMRLAAGFTLPGPAEDHHWWRIIGTRGRAEWRRQRNEKPLFWIDGLQMHGWSEADWRYERTDAPAEARQSGHDDLDYYAHAAFRDAVRRAGQPLVSVYEAAEIGAASVLAGESIDRGSVPLSVPDFRPGAGRPLSAAPACGKR